MATQASWEKGASGTKIRAVKRGGERLKFMIGGLLILGAVAFLIVSGTLAGAQYFITVDDMLSNERYAGETVRISGVVLGDSIRYDSQNLVIDFTIANIPSQFDDLATALRDAATDPNATRMPVRVEGQVKPDLLQHEAQAILTGSLGDDGVFYATELLLKCPSRFIEGGPEQVAAQADA